MKNTVEDLEARYVIRNHTLKPISNEMMSNLIPLVNILESYDNTCPTCKVDSKQCSFKLPDANKVVHVDVRFKTIDIDTKCE